MPKHRRTPKKTLGKKALDAPFEGDVRDLASDGRGIVSHPDGRVFFVAGCWVGERVLVKPTGRKGNVGFGIVESVLNPGAERREPGCSKHGFDHDKCGGCPWMFVSYEAQCQQKHRRVASHVQRLGVGTEVVREIIPAPGPLGYRNRAQFKTDGTTLGYVASNSNNLVDVVNCPVLNPHNQAVLEALRQQLPNKLWRADRRHGVYWHTLDIDDTSAVASLDARLPFRQGNSAQNAVMRQWLSDAVVGLDPSLPVLELFAGGGNFTEILAQHFGSVVAAEGDEQCIAALTELSNPAITPVRADLFNLGDVESLVRSCSHTKVLILDPPRDGWGMRGPFIKSMKKLQTIIYISCDPATWARDCADLLAADFSLQEVVPIDLFPQTPHVEIMSILQRS